MRATKVIVVASLLSSAVLAGCGPNPTHHQKNSALAIAAGGTLVALGALTLADEGGNDCSGGGAFCPDLSELFDAVGAFLIVTGAGLGAVGVVGLASAPTPPAPATTRPCSRRPARDACATRPPSDRRRTP